MKHLRLQIRSTVVVIVIALLAAADAGLFADGARVGSTLYPKPIDGTTRMFPHVAYDNANNAYLVVWGIGHVGARFVSASGALLGSPVAVSTTTAGPVRVACASQVNACLLAWIQEPATMMARLVRYNGGSVQFVTSPFAVNQNGVDKLTSAPPAVAYSSAANEFLVAWTEISSGLPDIKGQRVSGSGAKVGGELQLAVSPLWEGFPSMAYNSAQDEYIVVYQYETSNGTNAVAGLRVKPGTGSLLGRNSLASSSFDQYPEVAYNSQLNQFLTITWGFSSNSWMLRGRLANGTAASVGSTSLALAPGGGGNGIGLAYNPVTNTYLAVYQSQRNDEVWGVEVQSNGVPTTQFQVTSSGTTLAVQPRAAASVDTGRWLTVASEGYKRVMSQLVSHTTGSTTAPPPPTSSCTTVQPGPGWTCVNGGWLPPTTSGGSTSSCTTPSPGSGWTCVSGNWLPPTTSGGGGSTSSCTTVRPGSDWVCVSGNWLPPGTTSGGSSGGSSCSTPSPGSGWTCVSGNWLPPTTGGGGSTSSCTTVRPASNWTCVNGNWLPPTTGGSTGGSSSCTTVSPGSGWTCVNGNWLPPTSGGSTSSCTTVRPASNWVCVSGNWLPPTMSCTTVSPGAGWTCVSGNWLPPTTTTTTAASSCPTVKPGTGWTCVGGNWLPPGY